jgi:manganese/iron transport system permease protein/iron/zinc/copper transport system permease protein
MSILLEPFQYGFFQSAFIIAIVAGAICGLIGVLVVLRSMSYIGHGLSHAIFGWAVISFVIGVNFYVGAALGGFASALAVNGVARRRTIGADAAIGVVTTTMFAIGVALISRSSGFTRNFEAVLFGNILGSKTSDVLVVAGVGVVVVGVILLNYRGLLFSTFDPEVAAVSGVPVRRLDALLALILAGTIVVTMQVLGVMLVAAALVIPPVTARLLTDSFGRMLAYSAGIGALAGGVGMEVSYVTDIATGPAIVLVSAAMFVAAFAVSAGRRRAIALLAR